MNECKMHAKLSKLAWKPTLVLISNSVLLLDDLMAYKPNSITKILIGARHFVSFVLSARACFCVLTWLFYEGFIKGEFI